MDKLKKPVNIDEKYYSAGVELLAGADEAGRGPWAGPLVAAAIIMPAEARITGVADSKTLSEKQRERLFPLIMRQAVACCVVSLTPKEIDSMGVHQANLLAISYCLTHLPTQPDLALIDGFRVEHFVATEQVIEGDKKSYTIGCASIIAKVTRDRFMRQLDRLDPRFGFAAHKGYGTAVHRAALQQHGVTQWHRQSFAPIKVLLYT